MASSCTFFKNKNTYFQLFSHNLVKNNVIVEIFDFWCTCVIIAWPLWHITMHFYPPAWFIHRPDESLRHYDLIAMHQ